MAELWPVGSLPGSNLLRAALEKGGGKRKRLPRPVSGGFRRRCWHGSEPDNLDFDADVSTWPNGGVEPTQVAEWAGNSVQVLLRAYAKCIAGCEAINRAEPDNVREPE
ncbi:MAG TPA: hypothetical protein VFQ44_12150 [Streptosporangiaceae bacterium]|nr:hypothetical protein [Streptosporangiaceae bacterium]